MKHWHGYAVVPGAAQGMGSKRILPLRGKAGGRPILVDVKDGPLRRWQKALRAAMQVDAPALPVDGAVSVEIAVYQARPRGHYGSGRNAGKLRPSAPGLASSGRDLDKVARAILDAGTGVWWIDDRRVIRLVACRHYAGVEGERVEVRAVEVLEAPGLALGEEERGGP